MSWLKRVISRKKEKEQVSDIVSVMKKVVNKCSVTGHFISEWSKK